MKRTLCSLMAREVNLSIKNSTWFDGVGDKSVCKKLYVI